MRLTLDVQRACEADSPSDDDLRLAAEAALAGRRETAELCIRIVGEDESAALNHRYRGKRGPTNVLSFPCDAGLPDLDLLGDLVICAPVLARESGQQGKPLRAHWAHMVVHGVLHLLGFDHIGDHEAIEMEAAERRALAGLGIPDPYRPRDPVQEKRARE